MAASVCQTALTPTIPPWRSTCATPPCIASSTAREAPADADLHELSCAACVIIPTNRLAAADDVYASRRASATNL